MRIKKMYQGTVPENKILNTFSTSQTDTYCCDYLNTCLHEELIYNEKIYPGSEINLDTKKYKRIVIHFAQFDSSREGSTNTGGGNNVTFLDLSNIPNIGYYKTYAFTPYISSGAPQSSNFISEFSVNSTKTKFYFYCWYGTQLLNNTHTNYYVSKIYGQW